MPLIRLILASLICVQARSQGTWQQVSDFPASSRSASVTFTIDTVSYVGLGVDQTGRSRSFYRYSPSTDTWTQIEDLGGQNGGGLHRSGAVAFSAIGKGYVGLGQGNTAYYNDFWEYDPDTDSWTQKANLPGDPRTGAVAFSVDNKGYVGTGASQSTMLNDFYEYDPSQNTWIQVSDFPGSPRKDAIGVQMGDQGYVGLGYSGTYEDDFWQYNPGTNTWLQNSDAGCGPRQGAVAWANFPSLFVATGYDTSLTNQIDVWEYNYFSDSWTQQTSFPADSRSNAVAFNHGGQAYVGLGYDAGYYKDFYRFSYVLNTWGNEREDLVVYPNPVHDIVYFSNQTSGVIRVFDMGGRQILQMDVDQITSLNIENIPVGTYILCLSEGKNTRVAKIKVVRA